MNDAELGEFQESYTQLEEGVEVRVLLERDNKLLKKELLLLGVIARALVATLLDATGKGDETAIIFSQEDLQRASQLELEYQPLEDGTLALIMSGMTKQKEAAREDQTDVHD